MNVLIVTPWYKPLIGGVVSTVSTLARTLVAQGHRCSILVLAQSGITPRHIDSESPNLDVWTSRLRSLQYDLRPIATFVAWLVYFIPTTLALLRFIRKEKIDLVEVHYPGNWALYFVALRRIFHVRYVVHVHGSDVMANPQTHFLERWAIGQVIRHSDALVACSRQLLADTRTIFHSTPRLSQTRYTGISAEWASRNSTVTPQTFGLTPGKYFVCNAYPLDVKGIDILLEAFARIAAAFPDVDLALLGDRPDTPSPRELIASFGLESRVKLIGAVPNDDLPAIIAGACFGVIPSRREGFPRVVLEYLVMGKAIVASNVGGLPEAVSDGLNGFLVPPEDIAALAERLEFCLRNPVLIAQLGRNGHDQVVRRYSDQASGLAAVHLYQAIVASTKRPLGLSSAVR